MQLAAAACTAAILVCIHSAHAATLLGTQVNIAGSNYQKQITLNAATAQVYRIVTPQSSGLYYNVRIQLNQSEGHAGFYCNPSWGGQPNSESNIAQPGNAVWQTEDAWFDDLTISANDASYLPNNSTTSSAILAGLTTSASTYQPAFNCSVVNPSVADVAVFTLSISFDANNYTMSASEIEGITTIYQSCCTSETACSAWKAKTTELGESLYTNFCQFEDQYCSTSGRLQKLDMTSFGLSCAFPISSLELFPFMQTLVLSSNPQLKGSLTSLMSVVANTPDLQHLELVGNTGISGPLADADPDTSSGLCSVIQNGLQYLDFSNMALTGSLPSCLLGAPGNLSQISFASNSLTGTIPNVIPANSTLFSLLLDSNKFTGSIPTTIVNAGDLSNLELYSNRLTGSIPNDFGAGMYMLATVLFQNNNLTGTLPSPLATSISTSYLDVSQNQLTALPLEWSEGFANATESSYVRIFLQENQIKSPFPAALAQFPDLILFYANNNSLSGTLPTASHVFPQTRVIDLAYNSLTGSIPAAFNTSGVFNSSLGAVIISAATTLSQVFNVAHNNLTGSVPAFLAASAVPTLSKQGISLVGNSITADCGNSSFTYLDICDSLLNTTDRISTPSSTLTPTATPAATAAATPAATSVLTPAVTTPATTVNDVATDSGSNATKSSSKSGIGSAGIAGIVIGVLVALVLAATATTVYLKRKSSNKRTLLRMQSSGGFSRFEDF